MNDHSQYTRSRRRLSVRFFQALRAVLLFVAITAAGGALFGGYLIALYRAAH